MNTIIPINQQTQTEIENSTTHAPSSDDVQIEDDGLTEKQRRFADAYMGDADWNGTQAARLAGYNGNDNSLAVMAHDNLRHPKILAYMRTRAMQVISPHEALHHLAGIARRTPEETAQRYYNKKGQLVSVREDYGSQVKAITTILQVHGMLVDKVEHSGTVQQQVTQVIAVLHPDGMTTIDSTATETQTDTHTTKNE